ncbi:uncharacterized protein LOC133288281 [Gastrolobium bilobum]|uniref:uncharacterized protein LOC133288281 n=1 Tax=Gastrolobium bilobum TaxID=150636 RepID=UPI002AAFFDDD|nr:uncharacterized protein LOC133288281 [Gastrolobium bilobum]
MARNFSLRSILDANKLTGLNFTDWYRNVKIILRSEKIAYVLDSPVPVAPAEGQDGHDQYDWEAHRQHLADNEQAELYDKQGRAERFETSKELFGCKMIEGTAVGPHVLKMIGLIEKLASLGFIMDHELSIDLVLQSLPSSFNGFVVNYHMNKVETTLPELLNLLTSAEGAVKKNKTQALLIGGSKKDKGKGKSVETDKLKPKSKPKKMKGKDKGKGKGKS